MSPEARDHSFDELTRGLASGTLSRGKALRLMGAALVGGALASIPGIAWAKPNRPAGAKCKYDKQCASGHCVDSRVGRVCTAPAPECTPPCPANCSCEFAPDGTTTCVGCPPEQLCRTRLVDNCGQCTSAEVCVAGAPGALFVGCAPACTPPPAP
jgi:hypothetical protein